MRLQEQLRLAWLNCLSKRSISFQIILGLTITLYLFITVIGYISALKQLLRDTTLRYYASNCITVSGPAEVLDKTQATVTQQYQIRETVRYACPYQDESWLEFCEEHGVAAALLDSVIFIGEQSYPFLNHTGTLYEIGDYIDLRCYEQADQIITQYELQEYKQRTGRESPLMLGHLPRNTGELLIPACYAEAYGLQPEQLVGKRISLFLAGMEADEMLLSDVTVSGIIYNDFFTISNHSTCCIMQLGTISTEHNAVISLYPDSYADLRHIAEIFQQQDALQVSIPLTFMQYEYLEKQYAFANQVMLPTALMILIAMLLNIHRIVIFGFSKQMGYWGMLQAMGVRPKTLVRIHMLELAMQTLCALLVALGGYLLTEHWIVGNLVRIIHPDGGFRQMTVDFLPLGCTALILVFWGISALLLTLLIRKQNVISLLRNQ